MTTSQGNQTATEPRTNGTDYAPAYNRALIDGFLVQAVLFVLTALIMRPEPHRAFLVALLCQMATDFMILIRRPLAPTKFDLAVMRYGILPLFAVISWLGPVLLRLLGIANG